jgi:hypothetical protein
MAIATDPVPAAVVEVPTRVTPLADTLTFCPALLEVGDDEDVGVLGDESVDVDEPGSDGFADATQGVAATPIPTPNATANPPIRPIYRACPVVVYFALLIVVLPHSGRNNG